MTAFNDEALSWGDEIEGSGQSFEPVPAGEYGFKVLSMERQQHNGSDKMGPCPVAKVEISLDDPRETHVFDRLFLNRKTMWKIVAFFNAIGLHDPKDEAPFRPDWTRIYGRTGRVRIGVREYNGNKYNEVKSWLEPKQAPAPQPRPQIPAPQAWPQAPAPQQEYAPPKTAVPADAATQGMINQAIADARRAQMTPGAF